MKDDDEDHNQQYICETATEVNTSSLGNYNTNYLRGFSIEACFGLLGL